MPNGGKTPPNEANRRSQRLLRVRERLRLDPGSPSAFGSERSFDPRLGRHWAPGEEIRGYYIDFSRKAETPTWPPYWLAPIERQEHVATAQWGLGAYELYLDGEGDVWLQGARAAAEHLLAHQHRGGAQDGGWLHLFSMPHTYPLDPPWLSAMAQGEGASLLIRLYGETGDERYAQAAVRALKSMSVPASEGGTLARLDGAPFVEEYPTEDPSCVLNGAIFALWGYYDVGRALGDAGALEAFQRLVTALAANLWRYDTGYWSLYDLYPHPALNVASPAYHLLHIRQLQALAKLAPHPQFEATAKRFEAYRSSRVDRTRATAQKVAFRVVVPRNPALAHRLPWSRRKGCAGGRSDRSDTLVLCYHAVSSRWPAPLSVTPEQLADQLRHLVDRGYRGVTFSEAVHGGTGGKVVAVTFDDGYRSVHELARPILDRFGMTATVFVPTDFIGREEPMAWPGVDHWLGGEHERELLPMSWEQARELIGGGWEIGSHTKSHPRLTEISDDELAAQLTGSREECERRLGACASIAFPYGDHDARVIAAAAAAGYSAAATLPAGDPAPLPLSWPRIGVYHDDGGRSFRLKVSPGARRLRRSPVWPLLARALRSPRAKKLRG